MLEIPELAGAGEKGRSGWIMMYESV